MEINITLKEEPDELRQPLHCMANTLGMRVPRLFSPRHLLRDQDPAPASSYSTSSSRRHTAVGNMRSQHRGHGGQAKEKTSALLSICSSWPAARRSRTSGSLDPAGRGRQQLLSNGGAAQTNLRRPWGQVLVIDLYLQIHAAKVCIFPENLYAEIAQQKDGTHDGNLHSAELSQLKKTVKILAKMRGGHDSFCPTGAGRHRLEISGKATSAAASRLDAPASRRSPSRDTTSIYMPRQVAQYSY